MESKRKHLLSRSCFPPEVAEKPAQHLPPPLKQEELAQSLSISREQLKLFHHLPATQAPGRVSSMVHHG
jgi:hypothetical protein